MNEGGDIGWAMAKVEQGHVVRRASWPLDQVITKLMGFILVLARPGSLAPCVLFIAVQGDLLAHDWEMLIEDCDIQEHICS